MDITVQVRHLESGRVFGFTTRRVQQHKGWKCITYAGQRYQVFGGIRDYEFIDLCNPILPKRKFHCFTALDRLAITAQNSEEVL